MNGGKREARPVSTNATMTPRCDGPRWSSVVGDAVMSTVRAVSTFFAPWSAVKPLLPSVAAPTAFGDDGFETSISCTPSS